eukprot:Gb_07315 [translate_table: standard]
MMMDSSQVESAGSWWLWALPVVASRGRDSVLEPGSAFLSTWTVLGAVILMAVSTLLVYWAAPGGAAWGRLKRRPTIPGPSGWPVIGSLMVMGTLAHRHLARLADSHGARRLMAFSLGNTRAVISSHPDVAKEILNSPAFADRPIKESAYQLMFDRAIGFAPYSEYWRNLRRIATTNLFAPRRRAAFQKYRQNAVASVLQNVQGSMSERGSVEVRRFLQSASLNNVMRSVFGRSYDFGSGDEEAEELAGMVREGYELLGAFNWGDHLPLLRFLDLQRIRKRCSALVPRVNAFVQKIIDDHRAAPVGHDAEADFVDVLLSLQGNDKLSDSDMVAVLWEMIFRGTDTVAILMEWILARLVLHQNVQAKIHEELDLVVGSFRKVTEADIPKLAYLQGVVKEVLRIHPPGPLLSWARRAIHDVNVGDHFIPAGTTAMVNMWAITHDDRVWANALSFEPERFVPAAGGEEINIMGRDLRLAPFGSGRRVCPGKELGLDTVYLWLARMLHHYQWLSSPDQAVDLAEVLKLSCEMKVPLSAKAVRRNAIPF